MDIQAFRSAQSVSEFLTLWLRGALLTKESEIRLHDYYRNWRNLESARLRYWYDQQLTELEELVSATSPSRVLEVGSGLGTEALWLAWRGADVVGIELVEALVDVANERLRLLARADPAISCCFETCSVMDFQDPCGFDLIWMEQAFHHLEPRQRVVDKLAELLKPGGYIVFSEANAWNPFIQGQLLKLRGWKTVVEIETASGPAVWGNERILTARNLSRLMDSVGIETKRVRYYRCYPSSRFFDGWFRIEKRLSSFRHRRLLAPIFTHYNLVGRRCP